MRTQPQTPSGTSERVGRECPELTADEGGSIRDPAALTHTSGCLGDKDKCEGGRHSES